ncbi:hypothetical protein [Streptomyces sioyaensis]
MNLRSLAVFEVRLDPILDLGDSHWGRRRVINSSAGHSKGPDCPG